MAGAVPQQRGGSNATTIGMVVSIIVAVLLLGVLIWLITQQEQLKSNATSATAARDQKSRELDELRKGAALVIGGMTGNQNDTAQIARERLEAILATIRSEGKVADADQMTSSFGAVSVIEKLYQLYSSQLETSEKLTADFDKANEDLKGYLAANAEMQKKFGDDLAKLRAKVEELQSAKSDFEQLKSGETQALASQISAKQDALDALRRDQITMRRRLREALEKREALLGQQREALAMLRGPGAEAGQELAIARSGVGKVLRALPGDSLVHINLGRQDGVRLGMTFSVYNADERIPSDGRGKAHLEVVSVGRLTAECRVTTRPSPDNPILEGDQIGNIVMSRDKGKKQRFCIVGQFDIDFDGTPDIRGSEAIAALVRRYGGEVVDHVDAMTDYVVVGLEPPADLPPPATEEVLKEEPAEESAAPGDAESEDAEAADADEETTEDDAGAEGEEPAADEDTEATEEEADTSEEESGDDEGEEEEEPEDATLNATTPQSPVPAGPGIVKPPEIDPTTGPRTRRVVSERQRYEEAVNRAMLLSIPRLPQDRFFNFVGLESGREAMRALEQ